MPRLKWSKTRKLRVGEYEEKYDPGTVLKNGRIVGPAPQDSLAARAAKAEQEWITERKKKRREQRARRRAKSKPLTRAEKMRQKMIRQQLRPFD